jgi:hypothetical protein
MATNQELNKQQSNGNAEIARLSLLAEQAQAECERLRNALARCEAERDHYLKAVYAAERAKLHSFDVDIGELEKAAVGPVETIE